MKPALSLIFASALAAPLTAPCAAQWYWPPTDGLAVSPDCRAPADSISLTVSGQWPDSCIPNFSSSLVNGAVIDLTLVTDPPPVACPQIITAWSRTESVGPLPVGTYSVFVRYVIAGNTALPRVEIGAFSVVASCCYANCDNSSFPPILNANDFQCFLTRFATGESSANCDHSTSPPTLNANDFQCFLNAFASGCT